MCLAVPGEVLEVRGAGLHRTARVSFGGAVKTVSLVLVPEAMAGNYVLVHAGVAIGTIDAEEAARTLEALVEATGSGDPEQRPS